MPEYYQQTVAESLTRLNTNAQQGLSDAEVDQRRTTYGKNILPVEEGTNWVQLVLGQFKDLMVIILIVAAIVSAFLGDTKDVVVILAIVILNAIIGTYQEFQAEKALAALSAMQVPLVRVRRKGEIDQISAEELVPGDIVLLNEGDRIPADGRLIESINIQIDESALTGESMAVNKNTKPLAADQNVTVGDRENMAFMGTAVTFGRGEMVVTQTALKTELGNIAAMLLQVEQGITPLQRRLNDLSKLLAIGAVIVVIIVFIAGVLRGIPIQDMFLTSISLAVAAVPEGLPALITISLSLGAARMVRRHALIRRLPAVETLGSVTVICSDKTGTLTKNEMTATRIALPGMDDIAISGIGYTPQGKFVVQTGGNDETLNVHVNQPVRRFISAITLSTNAHLQDGDREGSLTIMGDTTEGALLVAAQKVGWTRQQLEVEMPRVAEIPFSSERKAMTTIHNVVSAEAKMMFPDTPFVSITKGAPDQLLEWASCEMTPEGRQILTPERRRAYSEQTNKMAKSGLRVLGIAYRPLDLVPAEVTTEIERELCILGLVGIVDPARPEARDAVKTARTAGIRPVMITGDHALTAEAIALDLGILKPDEKAVTGNQLDKMNESELQTAVKETSVFARVSPQHKLMLVQLLQKQNEIVAMTGDGVNDAPALKQADIGVAMGITGTDVSKGAAAMVLTDDNFASIVAAVEEGRVIYDNIRKFIKYLLSSNVAEILVMFIALLAGLKIPLLAIQILWINLVTDGLPAIAMGFEPAEEGVMKRKPRPTTDSVFAGGLGIHIVWASMLLTTLTLGSYLYGYGAHGMDPLSPTLALEYKDTQALTQIIPGEAVHLIPENWDAMTLDERRTVITAHESDDAVGEDASGGLIGAAEELPRTIAFSVLALGQIFHVIAIHAGDKETFFKHWFAKNRLLLYACVSTFLLQLGVIYVPFLRRTFETTSLTGSQLLITIGLAALMFVGVEIEKTLRRNGIITFAA